MALYFKKGTKMETTCIFKSVDRWEPGWSKKALNYIRKKSGLKNSIKEYIADIFPHSQRWKSFPDAILKLNMAAMGHVHHLTIETALNYFGADEKTVKEWYS
jgi:hypothetical protein